MLKTLGIVDACYRSRAVRSKAARKLGGKSVLEWVVRRATDCQRLDGVIVVDLRRAGEPFPGRAGALGRARVRRPPAGHARLLCRRAGGVSGRGGGADRLAARRSSTPC